VTKPERAFVAIGVELHASPDRGSRCSPRPLSVTVRRTAEGAECVGYQRPPQGRARRSWQAQSERMIARRAFLAAATAGAVLAARPAAAQPPGGVVRLGVLSAGNPRTAPQWVAFEQRLRELGYVDGQGFSLDFRDALGQADRMPEFATALASLKPHVIVAGGPEATLKAVRQVAGAIPVVMIAIDYDPIGRGHVAGLARPGGNVTGLFFRNLELT